MVKLVYYNKINRGKNYGKNNTLISAKIKKISQIKDIDGNFKGTCFMKPQFLDRLY